MIKVDRSLVRKPAILESDGALEEQRRMEAFFRLPREKRSQTRYDFDQYLLWTPGGEVRMALTQLFSRKCAYCESPVDWPNHPQLDHFRPGTNARELDGRIDPDHYWWLYYEWENLYIACDECGANKGDQFPVVGGVRARIGAGRTELDREGAMLLDPCADDPERHLSFTEDGRVRSLTRRGEVTIEVLGLNREPLVKARRLVAGETTAALRSKGEDALSYLTVSDVSYLALRRTMVDRFLATESASAPPAFPRMDNAAPMVDEVLSMEPPPTRATDAIGITYVERVEIQNFRAIRGLDLELRHARVPVRGSAAPDSRSAAQKRVGWKVLLGENGSGKSSVVQAICLALAGEANARPWLRRGRELLRRPADGEAAPRKGLVRVHLNRGEVIEFQIGGGKARFTRGAAGAGTFLRGYGATRLLPSPRQRTVKPTPVVHIGNLFNPSVPLHHASRWLAKISPDHFDKVARTLKDLLRIEGERTLRRDPEQGVLVVDPSGAENPLHHLSDGYQTMIALAVDIMAGLPAEEVDYQQSPGIVLLDELGTHLHPRWRMVIVESLGSAFSSMQFIATTHEPLCLRGLREGEIAVMRRDGNDIRVLTDLPSPENLRIDQLLTSPFFGLHTTIDPDVDRRFQEYYDLLATADLSPELSERRDTLRDELTGFGVLGYTRRDQLMYEVVDRYLAKAQKEGKSITTLPLGAKKELLRIWKRVGALREAGR